MPPPLRNIRVVDLTEALAGPYCTMILGDLGAEVVKIERPGVGDQSRRWGARLPDGESAYFASTNRNKRSLTLNIQHAEARPILDRLLSPADVFICNIPRVESLRKLGLDPEGLTAQYPRLIYASITGYGRTGPDAGRSGYDLVAQGEAGLMSVTGTAESAPIRFPIPLADMTTGMYTALAILAAIIARGQTGRGQVIDHSLLESQTAWQTVMAGDYFATGKPPEPFGNAHPGIVPYQVFRTADQSIVVAVGSDKLWGAFCELLGLPAEVCEDPRFRDNPARLRHRAEAVSLIEARLMEHPASHWLALLRQADIPSGPINSVPEALSNPHYTARGNVMEMRGGTGEAIRMLASPLRLTDTGVSYRLPPPRLGEHTDTLLGELGFGPADLSALRRSGTI